VKRHKDTSITVRLPLALKKAVVRIAESERRSLSQMVAVVLEQFVASRNERLKARDDGERPASPTPGRR